jgi:hypothetical protein
MQEGTKRSSPTCELSARAAQPAGRPACVCSGGSGLGPKSTCSVPPLDSHCGLWQCMAICCKEQLMGARGRKTRKCAFLSQQHPKKAPTHLRGRFFFFFSAPCTRGATCMSRGGISLPIPASMLSHRCAALTRRVVRTFAACAAVST